MSKAEHMGVSPSLVSGLTGRDSCPKQTTSEQTCQFRAECAHSEQLDLQHLPATEAVQNKPQEISTAVTTSHTNERFQAFSADGPDNSFTKDLVLPPEDGSKNSQTKKISCSPETMSDQKNGAECIHCEQSERKHLLYSEIVFNESMETSTVLCSSVDNENLLPVSKGMSKSSQTDTKQIPEFGSVEFNQLDAEFISSELSEQKHQLGSKVIQNEAADTDALAADGGVNENLQPLSEGVTKICHTELLQSLPTDTKSSQIEENSCPQQPTSDQRLQVTAGITSREPLEVNNIPSSALAQNKPRETSTAISCSVAIGNLGSPSVILEKTSPIEHLKQSDDPIEIPRAEHMGPSSDKHLGPSSDEHLGPSSDDQLGLSSDEHLGLSSDEHFGLSSDDMVKNSTHSETSPKDTVKNSSRLGCKGKMVSKSLKKKYMLRSLRRSDRVLRSRSGEKTKAPEANNNLADVNSSGRRKIKRQNIRGKKIVADEYSRIRTHLRYLLNRINYEQSLISAYSGEGWKGLSIEKLKPEKELQRATSEILRRKLKIRDLFQRLDSLCADGRFPESLFDSEGQIDSEDIFCAKCGSKDLTADDDIILCDGACDRGFHQYCLKPPLLKEEIPPDDEGWLCPGCDCKVDCIDLVNDSQGTNLSITDNWEKVFPEAAAAGHNQDPNFVLPSDDSDDNDYDPEGPTTDEKDQGDETSSDESDFASASDELGASANNNEYLGLPSDDSEDDDDYNPDAPVLDEKVEQESSSSDFTSDSEDLAAVLEDNRSSGNDEGASYVSPLRYTNGQRSQCGGNKDSLNSELLSILESGQVTAAHAYEKRSVERLDYKKLYDETYGNAASDSSDDEDWTDNDEPRKRTKGIGEGSPESQNGNASVPKNGKHTRDIKHNLKETAYAPKRRTRHKLNSEDTNISPAKSHELSSTPGSSGKREKSSYRRLGEGVTQGLYKAFKSNQYPDRSTKETLAKELGITFLQVSKWFENARWSFNHSSSTDAKLGINSSEKSSCAPQSNKKSLKRVSTSNGTKNVEPPKTGVHDMEDNSGDVMTSGLATQESNRKNSTTPTSSNRKRKGKLDHQASDPESRIEVTQNLPADSPKPQETHTAGRTRTKRRKTVV